MSGYDLLKNNNILRCIIRVAAFDHAQGRALSRAPHDNDGDGESTGRSN